MTAMCVVSFSIYFVSLKNYASIPIFKYNVECVEHLYTALLKKLVLQNNRILNAL